MEKQVKSQKLKVKSSIIEGILKELLEHLEVGATFSIEEKEETFYINLQTDNPGILIGYHGQTLFALQLILSLIAYRRIGEWTKIVVDVGDYRQRREETLKRMAFSVAQKVKFSHQEQELPPMSGAERRIIHLALSDDPEVETESRGEGKERRVVVKPRA
ncbi:MAG: protein jag [Microgenomates group bacterium]